MEANGRDPRLSPIAGDVTMNKNGSRFYIRRIGDDGLIWYQEDGAGDLMDSPLDDWRKDAADDTIIQRGDAAQVTP